MTSAQLYILILGVLFCVIYWFAVVGLIVHAVLTLKNMNQTTVSKALCYTDAIVSFIGSIIMAMLFIGFVYLITHGGPKVLQ